MIQTERHVQLRMVVNWSCPNALTPSRPSDSSKLGPWSCYQTPTALAYWNTSFEKAVLVNAMQYLPGRFRFTTTLATAPPPLTCICLGSPLPFSTPRHVQASNAILGKVWNVHDENHSERDNCRPDGGRQGQ
jgi:hypothetical protein